VQRLSPIGEARRHCTPSTAAYCTTAAQTGRSHTDEAPYPEMPWQSPYSIHANRPAFSELSTFSEISCNEILFNEILSNEVPGNARATCVPPMPRRSLAAPSCSSYDRTSHNPLALGLNLNIKKSSLLPCHFSDFVAQTLMGPHRGATSEVY
jgi:hypothetical protein